MNSARHVMAEAEERKTQKTRVESLSDLIFGLALSIGALTLIGQPPNDILGLLKAVLYYGFSFLILISVWFSYTRMMQSLHRETRATFDLNILLLFLVSIEPYLFNQLFNTEISTQYVSVLYAFDLAGLFLIQAFLANIIASEQKMSEQKSHYKTMRNSLIFGTAIFLFSVIPFIWEIVIHLGNDTNIHITYLIWIIPLLQRVIRNQIEKRRKSPTLNRKEKNYSITSALFQSILDHALQLQSNQSLPPHETAASYVKAYDHHPPLTHTKNPP